MTVDSKEMLDRYLSSIDRAIERHAHERHEERRDMAMMLESALEHAGRTPSEPKDTHAAFLFGLLDAVDTADDIAKGDHEAYRRLVRHACARRSEVMHVDGSGALRFEPLLKSEIESAEIARVHGLLCQGFKVRWEAARAEPWTGTCGMHVNDEAYILVNVAKIRGIAVDVLIEFVLDAWFTDATHRKNHFPWRQFRKYFADYVVGMQSMPAIVEKPLPTGWGWYIPDHGGPHLRPDGSGFETEAEALAHATAYCAEMPLYPGWSEAGRTHHEVMLGVITHIHPEDHIDARRVIEEAYENAGQNIGLEDGPVFGFKDSSEEGEKRAQSDLEAWARTHLSVDECEWYLRVDDDQEPIKLPGKPSSDADG